MGRAEQLERRRRRGRIESYEIEAQGEHPVWSPHRVKGRSGRSYVVKLWNLEVGIHHCSCPDFATNALGTCKHVEAVLHHLKEHQAEALQGAGEEGGPAALVYLDATTSPPEVKLHVGQGALPRAVKRTGALFGKKSVLAPGKYVEFKDIVGEAEDLELTVTPEAATHVENALVRDGVARDLAEASATLALWREALEAHRRKDAAPQDADEAMTTWLKRFGDLEPWALEGAAHLLGRGRAVLADDLELDKIRQTLAATELLRLTGRAKRICIATPASRRHLWRAAIRLRSGLEPRVVGGVTFEELARAEASSPYCVVTYNRLYRNLPKLSNEPWDVLVLDEVQRIKSWPAPTGQAIKSLRSTHAFLLATGGVLYRPPDFFYIVQILDPYRLGPAWQFLDQHVVRDGRNAPVGIQKMDEAVASVKDLWLKRSAADVSMGGTARRLELLVDVTQHQHRQIDPVLRTLLAMTRTHNEWSAAEREELVRLLDRLRIVCTAPELVKPKRPGSPKLDELAHLVEELCIGSGRRVAVFCRADELSAVVARRFEHLDVTVTHLTAELTLRKRQAAIKKLAAAPAAVLVISDDAACGLDLGAVTDVAIHAELPWSPDRYQRRREMTGAEGESGCLLEVHVLCTATPEHAAADALRRRAPKLRQLLADPDREMDALAEAEEWQLRELISMVVDERMVLRPKKALIAGKPIQTANRPFTLRGLKQKERSRRAQIPQQRYLLGDRKDSLTPREPPPSRRHPARVERPARPSGADTASSPTKEGTTPVPLELSTVRPGFAPSRSPFGRPGSPAGMEPRPAPIAGDVVVLSLETREDRSTCSQPSKVHTLGLAMAVTYSFRTDTFASWRAEYIHDLVRTLGAARLVVGGNPLGMEYKILGPYTGRNLSSLPTLDLLLEITKALGKRLSLDLVTGPTLETPWSSSRSEASTHFREGRIAEAATMCKEGARVIRDLFLHGVQHGSLMFQPSPGEDRQVLPVGFRDRLDAATLKVLKL